MNQGRPITAHPIGHVESALSQLAQAPRQGDEGAPDAWLVLDPAVAEGLDGLRAGDHVVVLTWLDRADRRTLSTRPRGDLSRPMQGVFSTRSPDRPNPIGLHRARIVEIDGARVHLDALEAIDGTPVLDLKPALGGIDER